MHCHTNTIEHYNKLNYMKIIIIIIILQKLNP